MRHHIPLRCAAAAFAATLILASAAPPARAVSEVAGAMFPEQVVQEELPPPGPLAPTSVPSGGRCAAGEFPRHSPPAPDVLAAPTASRPVPGLPGALRPRRSAGAFRGSSTESLVALPDGVSISATVDSCTVSALLWMPGRVFSSIDLHTFAERQLLENLPQLTRKALGGCAWHGN